MSGVILIWIRHCLVAALATLMAGIVLTVLAIGVVTVLLQRGPLELPQLRTLVEGRANKQMAEHAVSIGGVSLTSSDTGVGNRVLLQNVVVSNASGAQLIAVPELRTRFSLLDLVNGQLVPADLSIVGTELTLERDKNGAISLFGSGEAVASGENVLALLDALDEQAGMSALNAVDLQDTKVTFHDRMTDRGWVLDNSELSLEREGQTVSGRAVLELGKMGLGSEQPASMILSGSYILGSETASIAFQFSDASPTDIADLFEAFDWLRNLETRLSGSVRAELSGDGKIGNLHGVLEMAEGRLVETPASQPITFSMAKVYFDYDPETDVLNLDQVDLQTSSGSVSGGGFVELARGKQGSVTAMTGQLRLKNILIKRPDLFDADVSLNEAALDARVSFSPLQFDVGRLTVFDEETVIKVSGSSVAEKDYWTNSYDVELNKMDVKRLKQLWPKPVVDKTRKWVHENVFAGTFKDIIGGVRTVKGKPDYAFNFSFEKSNFNFLDTVPHLNDGEGFGYLTEIDLRLDLSAGYVVAPNGSKVDIAGSGLFVPDMDIRPTLGEVSLHAKGNIEAALGLLNVEKFRFLDKVGLKPNLGKGAVSFSGWFKVPLSKNTKTEDVQLALDAELLNLRSTELIENRVLTARRLTAKITEEGVTLKGDAKVDSVPVNATWTQYFGKGSRQSKIDARLNLTDKNLRAFGVVLPTGTLSGSTPARMSITLQRGSPPEFNLSSNLVGATMRVPALSWSKAKQTIGQFSIEGSLGQRVDIGNLVFKASGLEAVGTLELDANNSLQKVQFSRVNVGRWLSTSAVLTPRGGGRTDIALNGGTADLRYLGDGNSSGGRGSSNTMIKLKLDRVRVTNDLSLTGLAGHLTTKGGLKGTFVGRVNGSTRIDGQLFPQKYGTAIELTSKDAGGVMASAGLLTKARDGALRVVLIPREGDGNYDGTLDVKRTRIKDASALAALLNSISLVGALQQLEGEGIHFSNIEGQFELRNNGVKLEKISAVGPSMGMTLDGWYNTRTKSVDFEGVVTPLYVVNGVFERIFGQLVGRRKGEGMFSFTYRMRGPSASPKVAVNPLSILTPGAFREIFRQKPPAPPSQ